MYLPKVHEETRDPVLHALIRAHPLGCIVTQNPGGLAVNHIPFLMYPDIGSHGTLRGHVARANPMWQNDGAETVVIFQGADAYISPNWYPGKHQTGKAVPTWNYAVVHAHGKLKSIEDPAWLMQLLTDLTNTHEQGQALPWKVDDAPADYIERLLEVIVGIEIPVSHLTGKWKTSQNRPEADRQGVVAGLSSTPDGMAMAALVRETLSNS